MGEAELPSVSLSLHGPRVSVDDAVTAAGHVKDLLKAVGREMGVDGVDWKVASVHFQCDGCGLRRPDRPEPGEGWTYSDGDDLCPGCSAAPSPSSSSQEETRG